MSRVIVASICPWPLRIERPLLTPQKVWEIPAVPRGAQPAVLVFKDAVQWEKQMSDKPAIPHTVEAREIAEDFVLHTSRNGPLMTEDVRPGVWICKDNYPSPDEIAHNLRCLTAYCGALVEAGDDLFRRRMANEPNVPRQSERMKDAAKFLLLDREWLTSLQPNAMTTCVFCTRTVPSAAVKCPMCGEIINVARYRELTAGLMLDTPAVAPPVKEVVA